MAQQDLTGLDASGPSVNKWVEHDEADDWLSRNYTVNSVGWILAEDKDSIIFASCIEKTVHNRPLRLPKSYIRKKKYLGKEFDVNVEV